MSSPSTKKQKKQNNKTTTGTGKNTALLGLNNITEPSNENNINPNSTKKTGKKLNNTDLESKNNELQSQLDKLKSEIEQERNLLMQEKNAFNEDITEKGFEISDLTSENKILMSQLKELKSSLDNKVKIGKVFLIKMEKLKKEEEILNKDIKVKDKQIEMANKHQNFYQNDFYRIKEISENMEDKKEELLKNEFEELEKEKSELEKQNMEFKKIIKLHKICPKIKSKLTTELNVLKNAYEFEIKKDKMIESNKQNFEEKKEIVKKAQAEEKAKIKNLNNRSVSYCVKIRKRVLEKMKEKKAQNPVITSRASNHIANICNNIGDKYKNKIGDIKDINNSDYKIKQKTLFTENEQLQLAPIIPPSYLNEFKERFESIENQRYELADKLKYNNLVKSNQLNKVKIKLNYAELKKKEQKLLYVDLNSHVAKRNENISKIKSELNKITREYNTWNKLLKLKNNENIRLNKYVKEITKNKKNKNGNIEQNQELNKNNKNKKNIKINKNRNLEKQTNINFGYDMEK